MHAFRGETFSAILQNGLIVCWKHYTVNIYCKKMKLDLKTLILKNENGNTIIGYKTVQGDRF